MTSISLRLAPEMVARIDREASAAQRSRTDWVREAIERRLEEQARKRVEDMLREAAAAQCDGDAVEMAEEAMPLDNESLSIAEGG